MGIGLKTIAVLVVATLLTSSLALQSPVSARPDQRPSGCHGRSSNAPASGHDCCLTGHDIALPQSSQLFHAAAQCACSDLVVSPPFSATRLGVRSFLEIHFLDHADAPALRI